MKYHTAQPYITSYLIFRRDNKVAFVLRSNTSWMNGYYGLPSGKVEKNEAFIAAAIREGKEEVGVDILADDLRHALTMHRQEADKSEPEWVDLFFEVSEWASEPYNAEPEVHGELAWLSLEELPENVVPNVRYALEQIADGKTYCEFGWATP